MRRHCSEYGLTILEMLIALSIMVVVLGAVYATYAAATGSLFNSRQGIAQDRQAVIALRRMAKDIRCAHQPITTRPARPHDLEIIRLEDDPPAFAAAAPESQDVFLRMYTTSAVLGPDASPAGLYLVEYRLDTASGELLRRQAHSLARTGGDLMSGLVDDDRDAWKPIAEDVEYIQIEYSDGKQAHDHWNSAEKEAFPDIVNITLKLRNEHGGRQYSVAVTR